MKSSFGGGGGISPIGPPIPGPIPGGGPGRNPFGGGGGIPPIGRPKPGGGGGGMPPMGPMPMGPIPGCGVIPGCIGGGTGMPYAASLKSLPLSLPSSPSSSTCAPGPLPAHGSPRLLRPEARDERPVLLEVFQPREYDVVSSYQSDRIRGDSMNTTSYSILLVVPVEKPLQLLPVSSSLSYRVSYTFTPFTLVGFLPESQTKALTAPVFGSFRSRAFVLVLHLDDARDPDFDDQLLDDEAELLREETDMTG